MGVALSKDSQQLLRAASSGDVDQIATCVASEPRLIKCTTLLKRSSALHIAAGHGHEGVLRALVQPLLQDARQEVRNGDRAGPASKRLRQVVNAKDLYYRTPFLIAAKKGHLECVKYLADSGANVFACDREGNTCLHYAALNGHSSVVTFLLDKCMERGILQRLINKRNVSGYGALQYAVWGQYKDIVRQLLAAGADYATVNDRIFDNWVPAAIGSSALHLAVIRGSYDIALLLLEHYARQLSNRQPGQRSPVDPRRIANIHGLDPCHLASNMQRRRMARLLRPQLPIMRLFTPEDLDSTRTVGPCSLKSLAAAALQSLLLDNLDQLQQQQEATLLMGCSNGPTCTNTQQQQQQQEAASLAGGVDQLDHMDTEQQQQPAPTASNPGASTSRPLQLLRSRSSSGNGWGEGIDGRVIGWSSSSGSGSGNGRAEDGTSSGRSRAKVRRCNTYSSASYASISLAAATLQRSRLSALHQRTRSSSCICNNCTCSGCSGCSGSSRGNAGSTSKSTVCVAEAGCEQLQQQHIMQQQKPQIVSQQQPLPHKPQPLLAAAAAAAAGAACSSGEECVVPMDDADGMCCVCFEERPSVQVVGCGHAVCMGCARRLSEVKACRPPPCPLCRRPIGGFGWVGQC